MNTHLTAEQMQRYLVRRVRVDELGKLSEHLHGCRTCYGAYLSVLQRRFPIEIDFDELGGLKGWHLQGQELADYVHGRMSELDSDYAGLHLRECIACEQRLNDALRDWAEYAAPRGSTTENSPALWRGYLPCFHSTSSSLWRLAAAFLLVIGLAVVLWAMLELRGQESQIAITPVDVSPPNPSPSIETLPADTSAPGVGSDPVRRTERLAKGQPDSSPKGLKPRADKRQHDIETALLARDLVMPAAIEIFDKSPGLAVRGNTTHVESFSVVSPFSTLIPDEQPTFAWTVLSGATSYTVSVYDSNLRLVRTSPPLTGSHWLMPERLRRGTVYTWIVTAVLDGKNVIAPAPPARAEFKIIDGSALLRIGRRIDGIKSHAARGVIYAEAGLLDDAEEEFRIHLTLTPHDEQAKKLMDTVKSWRAESHYPH